ncbi:uncharacterized protein [Nicotiana tomentosiformis]|uniref:uncharacterized protein n=1 Tax=Nicotiana tomentosiformis TaxID=4098 RepID=UPI00388CB1DE
MFTPLANRIVKLDISDSSRVLACVVAQSSLFERIKAYQYDDINFISLKDMVLRGGSKEVVIGDDSVLRLHGRVCVSNVDGSRFYEDVSWLEAALLVVGDEEGHYWACFAVFKLPTLGKFDVIWVIVGKSVHFILVMTSYTSEKLAQIYIWEIVCLHDMPISVIS